MEIGMKDKSLNPPWTYICALTSLRQSLLKARRIGTWPKLELNPTSFYHSSFSSSSRPDTQFDSTVHFNMFLLWRYTQWIMGVTHITVVIILNCVSLNVRTSRQKNLNRSASQASKCAYILGRSNVAYYSSSFTVLKYCLGPD